MVLPVCGHWKLLADSGVGISAEGFLGRMACPRVAAKRAVRDSSCSGSRSHRRSYKRPPGS